MLFAPIWSVGDEDEMQVLHRHLTEKIRETDRLLGNFYRDNADNYTEHLEAMIGCAHRDDIEAFDKRYDTLVRELLDDFIYYRLQSKPLRFRVRQE